MTTLYTMFASEKQPNITLVKSLTTISLSVLYIVPTIENIFVEEGNTKFKSIDGVLMQIVDENNMQLLRYPTGNKREEYSTPEKVTSIAQYAFLEIPYLKKITFSDDVTTMENKNLYECHSIESIHIGKGLKKLNT